jgi:hypothetical protein
MAGNEEPALQRRTPMNAVTEAGYWTDFPVEEWAEGATNRVAGWWANQPAVSPPKVQEPESGLTPEEVEEFKKAWQEFEESKGDWAKSH